MGGRETAADGVRQVTYLFTDIEGSTGLWQEQPEAMAAALARHFEVLRAAVTGAGGEVVQDTGDGIFAVFDTAASAVRGAVAVQRGLRDARWGPTGPLKVRVGLHTGTVDPTLEDYRGTSVNRAARVMDVAHGGQVVCSGPTRELLRDTPVGEIELVDLGTHTLRGLAAAEHLWQVSAPDLPGEFPPPRVKGGAVSAVCPYKGLAAFQPEDAELFFGREQLVDRLLAQFASSRFLGVVGPSGSGKSSVVRAGLLPALGRGGLPGSGAWVPLVFTPTAEPVEELAHRLAVSSSSSYAEVAGDLDRGPRGIDAHVDAVLESARPDAQLLLVVDQFEEVFTLCRDEQARAAFVELLLRLSTAEGLRARVAVVLRADHYGSCATFAGLASLLSSNHVLVGPMDDRELRRAVTGPAEAVGLELEPALVDEVVADTGGGAGSLPLLSHALVETWARRSAATLTLEGYREAGGVDGAIARTAESLYRDRLDADQRDIARLIFLRLVEPGEGAGDSKRRAALDELVPADADEGAVREVLDEVVSARLVTTDETSVEIAHEALLREWPTLRRWLDDNREGLRLLRHLNETASAWDNLDRDPGELYRGARLAAVAEWLESSDVELNPTERAFVDASVAQAEAEERAAAERAARQARQNRRLRLLTGGLAVGLVLALVAGGIALDQRRRALAEQGVAEARELAAAAMAVVDEDAELALLLALEAIRRHRDGASEPVPEAERALHRAVTSSRLVLEVPGLGGNVALHPDTTVFVTEGPEESGLVDLRDTATGESVLTFAGHEADINDVAFNHDGTVFATAADDGLLRLWSTATGELILEQQGQGQVWGVTFSPDGERVAAGWFGEDVVRVIDVADRDALTTISIAATPLGDSLSFAPDGRRLAAATDDGVIVLDTLTAEQLLHLDPGTPLADAVAWSPDGRMIASSSGDAVPRITDADSGDVITTLPQHTASVLTLDWSADSARLATGSVDGRTRVFDVVGDEVTERVVVAARHGPVWSVALSASGDLLLTGDEVASITRIWDVGVGSGAEVRNLPVTPGERTVATFTGDGEGIVTTGQQEAAVVWEISTGAVTTHLGGGLGGAETIEVSPDGALVATVSGSHDVHVWDQRTGREAFTVRVPSLRPTDLAWSPDGEHLAIAGLDGQVAGRLGIANRVGELVTVLDEGEPDRLALGVAFSADGELLFAARRPNSRGVPTFDGLRVWDWSAGEAVVDLPGVVTAMAASPTDQRVAAAYSEGGLVVWNPVTGTQVTTLTGHNGAITDVDYSADGNRIASTGQDGTVRVWNAHTGAEQLVLEGHDSIVWSVDFSPDGQRLVSTGDDGLARVWALDVEDLVRIAESRRTRSLTAEECQRYLHADCADADPTAP